MLGAHPESTERRDPGVRIVGPEVPAIEGRNALRVATRAVVISSMDIVAHSTLGAGNFAGTHGRAYWVSGSKGSDAGTNALSHGLAP